MTAVLSTRFTETLGIDHPIVQGGMMWVSQPQLVAAVANAGGLGILTALTFRTPEGLAEAIKKTRALTERPFGVNLTMLPTLIPINYDDFIEVIIGEGITIVETAGRNPQQYMERLCAAGIRVIHKCTAVRFARKAEEIGCAMVSIDGCECAGHPGEDDITSLVLIPLTCDAVSIPVIASGGFADGRGLAAALALGADAINMGTRFLATTEAPIHPAIKQRLVAADERQTMLVMRSLRNTERVLRNAMAERVVAMEQEGATIEQLAPLLTGKNGLRLLQEGELDAGLLAAGQCLGLIRDVPSVKELIDSIMTEARQLVGERLPSLLSAPQPGA